MRSRALLVVTVAAAALVSSCSGSTKVTAMPSSSPSPVATVSPTPVAVALTGDPLTGLGVVPGPLVAVKVDNANLARPYQRGLGQAAIVFQELVEGGSTRFLAIFESRTATGQVGPVRSARESDVELLRGLGRLSLAFSGANSGVLAIFHAAARSGYLYDASRNVVSSLYAFGGHRVDANNYFVRPGQIGAKVGGSQPRDIGWRFGATTAPGAPTTAASVSYAGSSVMHVAYVAATGRWTITESGHQVPVSPANVVIQSVTTRASRFSDVHGKNTPYTVSLGSGKLVVMRDGRRYTGRWVRTGYGVTRLLDASGHDLLLKPGPTWVFLLPSKQIPSFR